MNAPNFTFCEIETQKKIIPLYSTWKGYEERKREAQNMDLSPLEYQKYIQDLAEELNL